MLLGEVVYKMGQKHRLALPKKFRQQMGDRLIVTRGFEGCLVMVSQEQWLPLISEVETASFLDMHARSSARYLLGGASEVGGGRWEVGADLGVERETAPNSGSRCEG